MTLLILSACTSSRIVTVKNTTVCEWKDEMVEISLKELPRKAKRIYKWSFVVTDKITGKELPYQLIYHGNRKIQSLIFPVSLMPGATRFYSINKGTPEKFTPKTYGNFPNAQTWFDYPRSFAQKIKTLLKIMVK